MNVVSLFHAQAEARPDAAAFVEGIGSSRRVTTFADVAKRGAAGAALLRDSGLRPNDGVLVLVPLSARLYEVLAAVFHAGLTAVVLDPGAGREHVERALRVYRPSAFVGSPKAHVLRLLNSGVRRIPIRFVTDGWVPGARRWLASTVATPAEAVERGPEDPALLTFTSGTTGEPRGVVRSHAVLMAQHAALASALELHAGQVDLATLPVVVLANLASGVTTMLPDTDLRRPGSFNAERVLKQIRFERPSRCTASPAFFERLLDEARPEDLASFERLDSGGAPVFPDLLERLGDRARNARVSGVFGSTEAEPIAHIDAKAISASDRASIRDGAGMPVGVPVAEVSVRILPDSWGAPLGPFSASDWTGLALPAGQPGEIVVSGRHVIPGYLNGLGDEETKVDVDGVRWHRTGDAGRIEHDGRLWLLGRCAHAVNHGATRVYPLQVEAAVRELTGLKSAFLEHQGMRTLVVEQAPASELSQPGTLQDGLAWAGIERVETLARLPTDRRHNAKIDVPALRVQLDRTR